MNEENFNLYCIFLRQNGCCHPEYEKIIPTYGKTGILIYREDDLKWITFSLSKNVIFSIKCILEKYNINSDEYIEWHSRRYPVSR